ncbi:MAG: ArsR/SmtB family transcription factor [Weeksellaceae bacterium]
MDIFSALSEPTRRRILEMLSQTEHLTASEISDKFDVSAAAISQHLKVLREANLVTVEKRAQQRLYKLKPNGMTELESWVNQMTQVWKHRFDRLEQVLEAEKKKL